VTLWVAEAVAVQAQLGKLRLQVREGTVVTVQHHLSRAHLLLMLGVVEVQRKTLLVGHLPHPVGLAELAVVAMVAEVALELLALQTLEAVEAEEQAAAQAAQVVQASSLSKLTNKTYDRKNLSFVRHQHGNAFVTPRC
jgi:hypothetical protein